MNRYVKLGMAVCLALALNGCAPTRQGSVTIDTRGRVEQARLANLHAKINESTIDDFGEFILEAHRAGSKLDYARTVYDDLNGGRMAAGAANAEDYARQGEEAANAALLHLGNAEEAFLRAASVLDDTQVISDLEDRLTYLESIHTLEGEEFEPVNIYFGFSNAQLNRGEEEKIGDLVKGLQAYPIFALRLVSYADTVGSKERNLRLAEQRNYSVIRALHREGLPVNTLISVAVGEVDGPDEVRNPDDRRVEIIPYVHGRDPQLAEALAQIEDARWEREMQKEDALKQKTAEEAADAEMEFSGDDEDAADEAADEPAEPSAAEEMPGDAIPIVPFIP